MQTHQIPEEIANRVALCREYFDSGQEGRMAAYGEMAEILNHYAGRQEEMPEEVEELYSLLLVRDGKAELEALQGAGA